MSTLVTINGSDLPTNSRADINGNFSTLNTDKEEVSNKSTDSTFASADDTTYPTTLATKKYVDAGGNVNASETTKGIVEEATDAEVTAGTATGGTGAKLFVSPAKLKAITSPVIRTYVVAGSPHTWTKPTGLKYIVVEVQAGGGAGGAIVSTADTGASGGGSGGYAKKLIDAATLGTTETVTIGATTSFTVTGGSTISCTTGSAGAQGNVNGGAGGTASNGDINIPGMSGNAGNDDGTVGLLGGAGANSPLGLGGSSIVGSSNGNSATGFGAGGGGAVHGGSASSKSGGAGAPGIVIVTEYYV